MKNQYDEYLNSHVSNVKKGYDWLCINLPELIKPELADAIAENIYMHDQSKYSDEEYVPYAEYFYGKSKSKKVESDFNYAWLHHIHYNPHHWQYWVLKHDDEPEEALEMPEEYVIEMICDWWSFSHKTGNLSEIFGWYEKHKGMTLHENTRKLVEKILDKIKHKLDELDDNEL